MKKLFAWLCAAVMTAPCAAFAQANQFQQAPVVLDSVTPDQMTGFLQSIGFQTEYVDTGSKNSIHIKAISGGGTFFTSLRKCRSDGVEIRCALVQPYLYFSGQGITLSMLNNYMLTRSEVSIAGIGGNGVGILASKTYLDGGVTDRHFAARLAYFFKDVDTLTKAFQSGALASVSYGKAAAPLDGFEFAPGSENSVNAVGPNTPGFVNDEIRALLNGE